LGIVKVLLDTHALLWWLLDEPEMSNQARAIIADPGNEILVSSASAWEIATKFRLGKIPHIGNLVQTLPEMLQKARMDVLPVSLAHALAAGNLPGPHRDPFDRMLIAQSRIEDLPFVTKDPVFKEYLPNILW
jgi:PIN domain nuclease of toxin-antitoxin system